MGRAAVSGILLFSAAFGAGGESALDALEAAAAARAGEPVTVRATYRLRTRMPEGALPAHEAEGVAVLDYARDASEGGPARERFLIDYAVEGRAGDDVFETWFRGVHDGERLLGVNGLHARRAGAPAEPPRPAPVREYQPTFLTFFVPAPGAMLLRTLRAELPHAVFAAEDGGDLSGVRVIEARPNPDWRGHALIRRVVLHIDAATGVVRAARYFGPDDAPVLDLEAVAFVTGAPVPESAFRIGG